MKWLDQMKQLTMTIVQNVESNLGYIMQTQMAITAIPILVSMFDRFRALFSRISVGAVATINEECKEGEATPACGDLLDSITTLNIEGADPASFNIFESVHPLPSGEYVLKNKY